MTSTTERNRRRRRRRRQGEMVDRKLLPPHDPSPWPGMCPLTPMLTATTCGWGGWREGRGTRSRSVPLRLWGWGLTALLSARTLLSVSQFREFEYLSLSLSLSLSLITSHSRVFTSLSPLSLTPSLPPSQPSPSSWSFPSPSRGALF